MTVRGLIAVEATTAAAAAARRAGVDLRELGELADLGQVDGLIREIWQPDPTNPPVTTELMRALTKAGNYLAGAYDGDELVGACLGFLAAPAGRALHSHVAGVRPPAAGRAIGFALKLHQRAWALRRGLDRITWTFDPLVARNAYFNLVKLAAEPAEYLPNFYGAMGDAVNGSDDSDRLLLRWPLDAGTVTRACATGGGVAADVAALRAHGAVDALRAGDDGTPVAGRTDAGVLLVALPHDIEGLRRTDPAAARAWRRELRTVLGGLMAEGARITGFGREGCYVVRRRGHVQ